MQMSIIWRKVRRDLWRNKLRSILVVISTAVGIFSLGFVYGLSGLLTDRVAASYQERIPAHLDFYTSPFNWQATETIRREPGVLEAEGESMALARWQSVGATDWQDALLVARPDYEDQRLNLCELVSGEWPDRDRVRHGVTVERMTARSFGISVGDTIVLEVEGEQRKLPVVGIARHPDAVIPPLGTSYLLVSQDTFAWLTGWGEGFNRLYVRLDMPKFDEELATTAGERIQKRLERMGLVVGGFSVTDPEVHQLQQIIDALRVILTVLGGLSLALSAFLIVNMMNATVAQQVWQIGVMKVVGATTGRIMRLYLGMALMYGMLAIAIAVPTSAVAAYLLAGLLLDLFNMTIGSFQLMPMAVGIQILMAILVPLLAALVPVLNGARISPHQAISNYGLGAGFGQNWLDRLIGRIRHLPRPLTLSLRNSFRRKVRVALTMLTLVMGGVMFVMVLSVGSSMNNTIEVLLQDLNFDVLVIMRRFYRVNRLISIAESTPGVVRAEVWNQLGANLELKNGDEREVFVWGVPPDSQVFNPRIISGRPLLPEDGRAILLNSKIAADEGFDVGDEITLNINDRESTWTVVGLILNINNLQRDNFVPFDVLSREEGFVNQGILVMIMTEGHDQATHQQMVREIRNVYEANRLEPLILQSAAEVRQTNKLVFNAIVYVMLAMAILAAIVGSVGLMSTMSINVVERSREIGVMRAVGATSVTIVGIFIAEGVLVGLLSWLIAVPLSYPGALLFNNLVSQTLFEIPLDFDYSGVAIILWWIIVTGLSAIASLWPALNATQVSVREALAYE